MKILVITSNITPVSGWGRYSLGVVENLRKRNHRVGVVVDSGTKNCGEMVIDTRGSFLRFFLNIFLLRSYARNYEVIHALDGWPYGVLAYFCVIGTRKKLFINGVGTYSAAPLTSRVKGWLLRLAYRRSSKIFCISEYTRKKILSLIKLDNTTVVHLGVSDLTDLVNNSKERVGEETGLDRKNPVFLTVGAIKYRKGQLTSLKALYKLKDRYPNFLYIMAGSGNDEVYVREIMNYAVQHDIEGNVSIRGNIDSDEYLAELYGKADVLLLNSINDGRHFEGFGLVIIEAAFFGVPAVGSRNCGIEDAIKDGITGYLAEDQNSSDIASKITKALERKDEMAIDCINFARTFTWEHAVLAYEKQYEGI
jgi:phosphatidylinositol alpha-1,6-mannosyltransferase